MNPYLADALFYDKEIKRLKKRIAHDTFLVDIYKRHRANHKRDAVRLTKLHIPKLP
jgi:hypothetical protein